MLVQLSESREVEILDIGLSSEVTWTGDWKAKDIQVDSLFFRPRQ